MQQFTGKQYLQMDIAANFGLDNKDWNDRLQWFEDNQHQLHSLIKQAKEPALYFAGVLAWEDVQAGKPSGYPISLDATCSGLQILSVLTGDSMAAKLCNVINVGHRADAYTSLYISMVTKLGQEGRITRDKTKEAILTALYGSTAIPKQIFGTGILLGTFHETMMQETPAVWELNKTYLSIWNPEWLKYSVVYPDNFHMHVKVMGQITEAVHFENSPYDVHYNVNIPTEEGRSLGANTTHGTDGMIVREMTRRCNYDPKVVDRATYALLSGARVGQAPVNHDDEMVEILWGHYMNCGYLSARILDHLQVDNVWMVDVDVVLELIESLPKKPFEIICIHDCFRCLPNYGNDMRKQYNIQLYLIAKSTLLSSILSQLLGRDIKIGKFDDNMANQILEADYAIC